MAVSPGYGDSSPIVEFSIAKALAVVGAVLGFLGSISHGVLSLLGVILYLVGMYALSQYYRRPEIFTYAFMASVGVVVAALAIGYLISALVAGFAPTAPPVELGLALLLFLVMYGAVILIGKYKRDLMRILGEYSDSNLADLAGKLYWWGAILTIIVVGLLLVLIAGMLEIIVLAGLREAHGEEAQQTQTGEAPAWRW